MNEGSRESAMFPNPTYNSSPSPYSTRQPPPGHQRNRIACTNCRKRKIKCPSSQKYPTQPCARCVKEGLDCEYAAVINEDDSSLGEQGPPAPRWVEPLDPESYARGAHRNRSVPTALPPMPQGGGSTPPAGHDSYRAPIAGSSQYAHSAGWNGYNQPPPPDARYATPAANVHYGPFPGPANTVYPWSQPWAGQYNNGGCVCASQPCVCGR
ncbi:hypothetical protein C8F01DRAFT_779578 [Mycena amicta]|nr:hypothetical protein C8F01DRAFT_779578 [Mycena amicta]